MSDPAAVLAPVTTEFELSCGSFTANELGVLSFELSEELSRLYSADLTLVPQEGVEVDAAALLGAPALLTLRLPDGSARLLHGIIAEVERWEEGTGEGRVRCRVRVVPKLWKLSHVRRSRIFQEKSIPEIVQKVLKDASIALRLELSGKYPPRTYCVQYRESDLDFVSRLLEEAGIFYYFEHGESEHTLVLGDARGAFGEVPSGPIVYREPSARAADADHIESFQTREQLRPDAVALREFDYLKPSLDLSAKATQGEGALEVYDYPGRYADGPGGKSQATIRLEELRTQARTMEGSATVRHLGPGLTFELTEHPTSALDGKYVLTSVVHHGHQRELLSGGFGSDEDEDEEGSDGGDEVRYRCEFTCIQADVPFRPERRTARPVVAGPQTAIVVGPAGEEIHTDAHGRVKVQFHWDREGKKDDRSSCWIRVSQAMAGAGFGALYLPRVGHEVVVEFLEGDPDQPIIVGSVYNGEKPPPVSLPDNKTQSTVKSSSSPGGGGANELRFEDAAGAEEVFLHAQKDLRISIRNDRSQEVDGNERLVVKKSRSSEVDGNQAVTVKKDDSLTVGGNQKLEVGKDRATTITGSDTETVAGDQTVSVGGAQSVTVGGSATETVGAGKALAVGGAYSVAVGGAMTEVVGAARAEAVGGNRSETVGGKRSETIAGGKTVRVGKDLSESIGGKRTFKVAKDATHNIGGKLSQNVADAYTLKAKKLVLSAEETFTLKVGSATIEVKKNGDITIKGAKVQVNASGDLLLKASKISEN